jgi:general stress protein YciG
MPLLAELTTTTLRRVTMAEKGAMTVREAGRKGGTQTKRRHGPDFCKSIGKKGGETTKQRHGREHYEEIGRKGGQAMKEPAELARRAQKGR